MTVVSSRPSVNHLGQEALLYGVLLNVLLDRSAGLAGDRREIVDVGLFVARDERERERVGTPRFASA